MEIDEDDLFKKRVANYSLMMSKGNVEILSPEEDLITLECAAYRSRLPENKMTTEEKERFPELAAMHESASQYFLYLRNKILQLWLTNSREQLTVEQCKEAIPAPYNGEVSLIERIHKYLERYGYINFGVYAFRTFYPRVKKSILVLGAGISGLAAARQLECFGFDVTVIEARDRIGGRISTYKKDEYVAELGAMVVMGLSGNPLITLSKQIHLELREIKSQCPLFDGAGKPIPKEKDDFVEREHNRLLQACAYFAHTLNVEEMLEFKMSFGDALDAVIHMQEVDVRKRYLEHMTQILGMQTKLTRLRVKINSIKKNLTSLRKEVDQLESEKDKPTEDDPRKASVADFMWRSQLRDFGIMCNKYEKLVEDALNLEKDITDLEKKGPCKEYLGRYERNVLDWHFANLEFSNAAPLNKLSLKHWDQDDENEFSGPHLSVQNGFSNVPEQLAEGLTIRYNEAVREICYTAKGAEIVVENLKEKGKSKRMTADAVICTLPLGVLKKSIVGNEDGADTDLKAVVFSPPLPDWKKSSIERLGYGNLNKVILFFDRVFWDPQQHMFGYVNAAPSARGELFLFWAIYTTPVLIALNSGEAADTAEEHDDNSLMNRCLTVLRVIFGSVPQPKDFVVTRWGRDPWSFGSYSYVGVEASGKDYDVLGKPLSASDTDDPTLFFAGEHTNRTFPASVPGAMLSGMREAGRIADQFLGPI